jgi:hypothetical protein
MVELSRDDWRRLTSLIHGYGSVAALEHALGGGTHLPSSAPATVDLADMVRTEVAHQLGARDGRPQRHQADAISPGSPTPTPLSRGLRVLWPASGAAWISLALILLGGMSPIHAAATGIFAVVGLHLGLRRDGQMGLLLWQVVAVGCVIAWALRASWPVEASALVLGSVLAGCIAEPLRSRIEGWGAS